MASRRTRSDGRKRREALMDAALRCFAQHGILETGIEEIRRQAGASPSSVYHHFDGLTGLTTALLVRTFERAIAHINAHVLTTTTAEAAVRALVSSYLDWALGHQDEARFMYQAMALELGEDRETLLATKAELQRPLFAHLARLTDAGELPNWPPATLDIVLLGASHDACRRHLSGADLDIAWMRTTLPELAWRSIRPDRPSRQRNRETEAHATCRLR
jgi:AcrR family transcriptional regulator